jgi:hypothetical protein
VGKNVVDALTTQLVKDKFDFGKNGFWIKLTLFMHYRDFSLHLAYAL